MSRSRLNFIDIFSGAGGMSCGLELAGHRCLLGVDIDKYAIETFKRNHKHAEAYCGDVEKLTEAQLKKLIKNRKINAVVGGPPCQGFSTVGTGDPKDTRNSLFRQFLRIVKITGPEFIVIENVTGLLAKKNEETLKSIFRVFHRLGYTLDVQVMEAQRYGVPERRRRTIIIGSKVNDQIIFPRQEFDLEKAGKFIPAKTVGDVIYDLKVNKKIFNHDLELARVKNKVDTARLKCIPEGKGIRYEADEKAYLPKRLRLDVEWGKIRENRFRQTKYYRLDRKLPSPTIMTHRHSYYHPIENRFLTQREAAKLQSFPNDFIFEGPLSAQWRQIGNAVPPLLAKSIGHALRKMYNLSLKAPKQLIKNKSSVKEKIQERREKAFVY